MDFRKIKTVLILGAGTMGWQIGILFAQKHYNVIISDIKDVFLTQCKKTIEDNLSRRVVKAKISKEEKNEILNHFRFVEDWIPIVSEVDLVIEAVVENLEIKTKIFKQLSENVALGTICGTNSSTISINRLVKGLPLGFTNYCMNIHFSNPVLRLPLVELYSAEGNIDLIQHVKRIFRKMRYEVVVFRKPVSGFVMNRILGGALHEVFYLLENDVCDPEDIDAACTAGLNWPMGACRVADLVGLDVIFNSFKATFEESQSEFYKPPKYLESYIKNGKLGFKTKHGIYDYTQSNDEPDSK